jgi:hypothetical protein
MLSAGAARKFVGVATLLRRPPRQSLFDANLLGAPGTVGTRAEPSLLFGPIQMDVQVLSPVVWRMRP